MPIYAFYCDKCDGRADEFLTFAQHDDKQCHPVCLQCDRRMSILLETAPTVSGNGFTPYWNQGLGCVVHSAREQDSIAKAKGLELKG